MSIDEYRARAEECEAMARQPDNYGAKTLYENLACQWKELAKQAEERESTLTKSSGLWNSVTDKVRSMQLF
jgi:hypothetical protein